MKVRSIGVIQGGTPEKPVLVPAGVVFEMDDDEAYGHIVGRNSDPHTAGVVEAADEAAEKRIQKMREERLPALLAPGSERAPQGVADAEHEDAKASAARLGELTAAGTALTQAREGVANAGEAQAEEQAAAEKKARK